MTTLSPLDCQRKFMNVLVPVEQCKHRNINFYKLKLPGYDIYRYYQYHSYSVDCRNVLTKLLFIPENCEHLILGKFEIAMHE